MDAPYSIVETLEPGIGRALAHNPSAFTYYGTQTYIVGEKEVAVIDPGPDLMEHVEALIRAIAGRPIVAIMCTHTHRDHSPASRPLANVTGAPIVGCAPLALETVGPRADAAFDGDYVPDRVLEDGESIAVDGRTLTVVATPGHTSNHLCFALGDALFTGDHVMGWSTSVISPPDGDMRAYMASLDLLQRRDDAVYWPTHGGPIRETQPFVAAFIAHRREREDAILACLKDGIGRIRDMVPRIYGNTIPTGLYPAAARSVFAHMIDLAEREVVRADGAIGIDANYRLSR